METNCYLIYEDASYPSGTLRDGILIDPGFFEEGINACIRKEGIKVNWILNTHGHPDHTAGNEAFTFPIMIHKLDAPFLSVSPERFLEDGDVIKLGGLDLEVLHTPGHTPGGVAIRCGGVLFSGDTLFFEGVGRTDLPGGSSEALIKSIKEKLMTLPDSVKVFPGHGPETTIEHERRFNRFL